MARCQVVAGWCVSVGRHIVLQVQQNAAADVLQQQLALWWYLQYLKRPQSKLGLLPAAHLQHDALEARTARKVKSTSGVTAYTMMSSVG